MMHLKSLTRDNILDVETKKVFLIYDQFLYKPSLRFLRLNFKDLPRLFRLAPLIVGKNFSNRTNRLTNKIQSS